MHHIDDPASLDDLLPSKSCSDDIQQQQQQQQPPGANMLSMNEIRLCSSLNLPPTRYITLKTVLLSGSDHSYAIKQEPSEMVKGVLGAGSNNANSSHIDSIKKYLTKAGWLAGGN